MKINENKIPIKYYLNFYSSLDEYPTNEDILYEILSGESVLENDTFTYKEVKYAVKFKMSQIRFEDFIEYCLGEKLIQANKDKSYTLIKNLWS